MVCGNVKIAKGNHNKSGNNSATAVHMRMRSTRKRNVIYDCRSVFDGRIKLLKKGFLQIRKIKNHDEMIAKQSRKIERCERTMTI